MCASMVLETCRFILHIVFLLVGSPLDCFNVNVLSICRRFPARTALDSEYADGEHDETAADRNIQLLSVSFCSCLVFT